MAVDFVAELSQWAKDYYLEPWIVEDLVEALNHRRTCPGIEWESWPNHVMTSESCPLEPEEHVYYYRIDPDEAVSPVVRALETSGRAFVFAHPGYRPAGVRRSLFITVCMEQFEEALKHYVEGVERDYLAEGYVATPEMRDATKFEWAVLRRNRAWSLEQLEDRYSRTRSTISLGIKEVEKAMRVPPLEVRVTKNMKRRKAAEGQK